MAKPLNIQFCIGIKLNRLAAIKYDRKKGNHHYFIFICDCGVEKSISWDNFKRERQKSCGCIKHEGFLNTKHPLYRCWQSMKQRCSNPEQKFYKYYGGRGVRVCDEWINDFEAFAKWAEANGWEPRLEIDKDKNKAEGGLLYAPHVCEWITHKENMQYIRRPKTIVIKAKRGPFVGKDVIDAILASPLSSRKLEKLHGISRGTIQNVRNKKHGY